MYWLFGNRTLTGGTLESCRLGLVLLLLVPVALAISQGAGSSPWSIFSPRQIIGLAWALPGYLLFLVRAPQVLLPPLLASLAVLAMIWLLLFALFMSVTAVLGQCRALSLINLLLAATAGAALSLLLQGLGAPAGSYGGTPADPLFHLPLFEEFAADFINRAALLDLGALAVWLNLRFVPRESA